MFFDARPIFATLPTGTFSDLAYRPSRRLNLDARVEHVLTKTHTARFQFQRNAGVQNNLGVGDFDLPARGYSQDQTEYIARFADSGVFGKKFFNEVRFQARWMTTEARSVSLGQTILVPGAFNDGSAQRSGGRGSSILSLRTTSITHSKNTDCVLARNSKPAVIAVTIDQSVWHVPVCGSRCLRSRIADAVHATHRRSDGEVSPVSIRLVRSG